MSRTDIHDLADVPDDLTNALHAAAHAAPPYHGDLVAVRGRGRAYRHQRIAAVAGFAALAAAAAIAVPTVVTGQTEPPSVVDPLAVDEPAQRLVTDTRGYATDANGGELYTAEDETVEEAYERLGQLPGAVGVLADGVAEIRPDRQVIPYNLDVEGIDSVRDIVPMPDGRLVVIGIVNHLPGVERPDGPCVEGLDFPLLVVEADGSVATEPRNVGVRCQALYLAAADAENAYLIRGTQLVAHELVSGQERVLLDSPEVTELIGRGSVAGGRLAALAGPSENRACAPSDTVEPVPLTARIVELDTGETSAYPVADSGGCSTHASTVRVSPDGRYLAVAYQATTGLDVDQVGIAELRLAIMDLDGGEIVTERVFVEGRSDATDAYPLSFTTVVGGVAGLAWDDDRTLRVAWYEAPDDGLYRLSDVVRLDTFTVP